MLKRRLVVAAVIVVLGATTLLIDAKGQIVGTLAGPAEWDSAEAEKLIEYVLERTVALAH